MNRREFLKTLGALAAAASLPAAIVTDWRSTGIIQNEIFSLKEPLDLSSLNGQVSIINCSFYAEPGFVGDYILDVSKCDHAMIIGCHFDLTNMNSGDAWIG